MKKILALALAAVMTVGTMVFPAAAATEKTTINLWAFTDEVPGMMTKFLEAHPELSEKYDINTTIIATTDGAYQPALDAALANGEVDIYAAEAAFVLKYAQGDASEYAASYADLGIDVDADVKAAEIAQYTVDIGTRPSDNALVALGYQATGGVFIYRRSIAKAVWGNDDPAFVAEKIGAGSGSWDAFFAAAQEVKDAGYAMVSGDGDIWHAVENSSETGWIVDGKLNIDPAREAFLDLSKKLHDNGFYHDTTDWQEGWFADMKKDGGVLGFYGPAWLINYTIAPNSGEGDNSSAGDWACCAPNIGFFWGGTWLLAGKNVVGTEKAELVRDFIHWVTLDCTEDGLQYKWANGTLNGEGGTKDCVASGTVMAKSNGELDFLGGQNMFDAFVPANAYANGKNLTQYDESINTAWRDAVRQYAHGEVDRDTAIENFKITVADTLGLDVD